ncbi:unnamed protein product [Withania somnifera]
MGSFCIDISDQIQVEIMSKKIIKPSLPTPNHLQNYKLSFFDQIAEKTHMPVVLFYPHKPINSFITAILWRAQLRASQAITGKIKPSVMSFPLSLRGKLKYPEAANPFGNFIIEVPRTYEPKDSKMELQDFIILIRETVQKVVDYCSEASADEVVALVVNLYNQSYGGTEWGTNEDVEEFTCSSLTRFHMQEADFGWGNPNLIHFGSRHHQIFWLYSTTQSGNTIAVQMDLKENYMDFIVNDQEFLAFTGI